MNVPASTLQPGNVISPPARELRLWMNRGITNGTLSPDAIRITLTAVEPGKTDAGGPWLILRGEDATPRRSAWNIQARPATLWPVLSTEG